MPFAADVGVEVFGVTVIPGDYVFADRAGAVVVPAGNIDDVLDEAHRIADEDAQSVRRIMTERPEDFLR